MPEEEQYVTKEKKKELEEELEYLKSEKRKDIAEQLEYAKSLGDLSENAEYHQARADQVTVEERILKIEQVLKYAKIVSHKKTDVIQVGSSVVLRKEKDNKKIEFQLVGSEETDTSKGLISNTSPLGSALIGKKKGEKFVFTTPAGVDVHYTVVSFK